MHDLSIHLIPFLEMVAAIVATPVVGIYIWRGLRRRKQERLRAEAGQPPALPPRSTKK